MPCFPERTGRRNPAGNYRSTAACLRQSAIALLLVLLGSAATTQHLAAEPHALLRLSEYQKQQWQVEDGLPSNNVRMVAQQPDGMLLLATSAGLAKFDGLRFEEGVPSNATLSGEAINAALFARDGSLWLGTDGQGVLHIEHGAVHNVSQSAGFTNERVRMLFQDPQGSIWIATQNGIERYTGGSLQRIPATGMLSGDLTQPFAIDGSGGIFYLTTSGLFLWKNGAAQAVPIPSSYGSPTAIYREPNESVWLGTTNGVVQLTQSRDRWEATGSLVPVASPVTTMLADRQNSLWIGTRRNGLYRQSELGLEHWDSLSGLQDEGVKTLFFDDENNLWIGTLTGGLSRWREGALAPYGRAEGFPADYAGTAFADSHGNLWLGTWDKGLFRRTGDTLESVPLPGNPRESPIRAMTEDRRGDVWIGTWFHGIYRYDGKRATNYLLGNESPGNAISSILSDSSGGLWVGTYEGVLWYPNGTPDRADAHPLLEKYLITSMVQDVDGSVLIGTSNGLFRVRNGKVSAITGLVNDHVLIVFRDTLGTVWVSTLANALQLVQDNTAQDMPAIAGQQLPPVHAAVNDDNGNLWLGTSRGILRIPIAELHAVFAGQKRSLASALFDRSDGLRSSECSGMSRPLATRTPDGTLWFATTGGFVHTTRLAESADSIALKPGIRGWALTNNAATAQLQQGVKAVLPPGTPDVLFFFWAKRLADASRVEFRYRLVGYDHDWTVTSARIARYRWLPPGHYRFEVQAHMSNGAWNDITTALPITQKPFFYQTWWFQLAVGLLALCGLYFLIRMRVHRRIQSVKGSMGMVLQERNRIAQECHDSLMAGFAAISWQLEATSKLFRDADATSTPAAKSCELARSMVLLCQAEARRIIWDLRDTDDMTSSLSSAVTRMLDANHTRERILTQVDIVGDEVSLAPGCVHHLTRIGQEAISNALRHGKANSIHIQLEYGAEALQMRVKDDGCGFLVSEEGHTDLGHFGIAVMQERARKLGGTLRMQSSKDGTEVAVSVPFQAADPLLEDKKEVTPWIGL